MLLVYILATLCSVEALNNGLARTPPLGWLSWERFRCITDCELAPDSCLSEKLIMTMADHIAADGFKDAGYEYVCLDDCWPAKERTANGSLIADPKRFPSGMKALADYVHSKGLKIGTYADFGTKTCGGFPGSEFYLQRDAQTFADWGIDLLKFDDCDSYGSEFIYGFPAMEAYLNQTGRPMLFSCAWPHMRKNNNFTAIDQTCNIWRIGADMEDSWDAVIGAIDYYAVNGKTFLPFSGPGSFADADEVIVGNFGLSYGQEKAHFGMWAMFASPIFISVDLRNIRKESKELLLNKHILALNQDPLGKPATFLGKVWNDLIYLFNRELSGGRLAVAFVSSFNKGTPSMFQMAGKDVGLTNPNGYDITDGFTGEAIGSYGPTTQIPLVVNPTGIVLFIATPK